jgi:hypothetical protein
MPSADFRPITIIVSVNRHARIAVSEDDVIYPILAFYDAYGDQCGPDDATVCVAGSNVTGWVALDLNDFIPTHLH